MDIPEEHLKTIQELLKKHVFGIEVRVFGSRVNGNAKPYSDLDIALITSESLSPSAMAQLKAEFSESNLPFKVDVLDWTSISESFKELINQNCQVIQLAN